MYNLEQNDIQGFLMLIDFEKAFDTISWSVISKSLDSFNVG